MHTDHRPDLPTVGIVFLGIGTVAFGGLGAALSIIQREAVEKRDWLAPADLADALAFTKPLPGSTVVQVVAFLGWRLRRWPGVLVGTLAFLAPSVDSWWPPLRRWRRCRTRRGYPARGPGFKWPW